MEACGLAGRNEHDHSSKKLSKLAAASYRVGIHCGYNGVKAEQRAVHSIVILHSDINGARHQCCDGITRKNVTKSAANNSAGNEKLKKMGHLGKFGVLL